MEEICIPHHRSRDDRARSDTPQTYGTLKRRAWRPSQIPNGLGARLSWLFRNARIATGIGRNMADKPSLRGPQCGVGVRGRGS